MMLQASLSSFARAAQALPKGILASLISTSSEALQPVAQAATAASQKPVLLKEFQIYRWNPDEPEKPKYASYKVDINR
jgi:hypothetical protein